MPAIITKLGASTNPWRRLDIKVVQEAFDAVYPEIEHTITKDDEIEGLVRSVPPSLPQLYILKLFKVHQRVMGFRNLIGKLGVENVQSYLKKFDTDSTQEYVNRAFDHHGEIPFLYKTFKVTEEANGGYKVVRNLDPQPARGSLLSYTPTQIRRGLFRHRAIILTMLGYYQAIKSNIRAARATGINPVGALALVCAAVSITFNTAPLS
jgi:hypothetical protein